MSDLKRYRVYRNLTKKCLSVTLGGRLVGHCDHVLLIDVTFHVSESGRQRVINTGHKNVHAVAEGYVGAVTNFKSYNIRGTGLDLVTAKETDPSSFNSDALIGYNPYKYGHFYRLGTGMPVESAKFLLINGLDGNMAAIL